MESLSRVVHSPLMTSFKGNLSPTHKLTRPYQTASRGKALQEESSNLIWMFHKICGKYYVWYIKTFQTVGGNLFLLAWVMKFKVQPLNKHVVILSLTVQYIQTLLMQRDCVKSSDWRLWLFWLESLHQYKVRIKEEVCFTNRHCQEQNELPVAWELFCSSKWSQQHYFVYSYQSQSIYAG